MSGTEITKKYLPELKLSLEESNISRNTINLLRTETHKLIESNKELFSSFYAVPTPYLPKISLEGMGVFYYDLFNKRLKLMEVLFEHKKIPPLDLYQNWILWLETHIPNKVHYGGIYAMDHFIPFICEKYFNNEALQQAAISLQSTFVHQAYFKLQSLKNQLIEKSIRSQVYPLELTQPSVP